MPFTEYDPAVHATQLFAPSWGETVPDAQGVQSAGLTPPGASRAVPGAQRTQPLEVWPSEGP